MTRDYNTISPSAKLLLMMKGLTNIPYARRTAELIAYPEHYDTNAADKDLGYLLRVLHFENRYWSIDQLLYGLNVTNIMELSSGFSFRGIAMAEQQAVHYIDTDLPDLIAKKKELQAVLKDGAINLMKGKLETLPLNALDEDQFKELTSHFPEGPVAIVNEGLLMYLNMQEKIQVCGIIHRILKAHGGCWITADIYVKNKQPNMALGMDERAQKFFEQHHIDDNKFDSYEAAESFFAEQGFILDKVAATDTSKLSILPEVMRKAEKEEQSALPEKRERIQQTWRLRIA